MQNNDHLKTEFHKKTYDEFQKNLKIVNKAERIILDDYCQRFNNKLVIDGTVDGAKEYDAMLITNELTIDMLELKFDFMSTITGNFFCEFIQNGKPSGIETTHSNKYGVISPSGTTSAHKVYIISTDKLKELISNNNYRELNCGHDKGGRARGYLIPISDVRNNCIKYYEVKLTNDTHFEPTSKDFYSKLKQQRNGYSK